MNEDALAKNLLIGSIFTTAFAVTCKGIKKLRDAKKAHDDEMEKILQKKSQKGFYMFDGTYVLCSEPETFKEASNVISEFLSVMPEMNITDESVKIKFIGTEFVESLEREIPIFSLIFWKKSNLDGESQIGYVFEVKFVKDYCFEFKLKSKIIIGSSGSCTTINMYNESE